MITTKNKTFVVGHKNPDTDSVAAAYALAYLKQITGCKDTEAICAGLIGERTEFVFNKFNIKPPRYLPDIYPRIQDILINPAPFIFEDQPIVEAISLLNQHNISQLPVINRNNNFCGMFSLAHLISIKFEHCKINNSIIEENRKFVSSISLINSVLLGNIYNEIDIEVMQEFKIHIATMQTETLKDNKKIWANNKSVIVIVSDRKDIQQLAIEKHARIIIITNTNEIDKHLQKLATQNGVVIIATELDTITTLQNIKFSSPTKQFIEHTTSFLPDERLCDIKSLITSGAEEILPVINEHSQFVGVFKKSDLNKSSPFNLILVDHNEFSHAINGIEEVPIIEVVDHHRFGMQQTDYPVKITCDVVGSTCTIVTEMFQQAQKEIPKDIAGILLGGIITDTLLLRSPTTTLRDSRALHLLEDICEINAINFADEIYSLGSIITKSSSHEILSADRKSFNIGKTKFAVAQIEEVSFIEFNNRKEDLLKEANKIMQRKNYQLMALLVTNVASETSQLLAVGTKELLRLLPFRKIEDNLYDLPGVLSRKKQLIPQLSKAFSIVH